MIPHLDQVRMVDNLELFSYREMRFVWFLRRKPSEAKVVSESLS